MLQRVLLPFRSVVSARLVPVGRRGGRDGLAVRPRSIKTKTGLVGLDVVPNARAVAIVELQSLLTDVAKIPADVEYRKQVETCAKFRLDLLASTKSDQEIEDEMNLQLEEIIEEIRAERTLVPRMLQWRAWEKPTADDMRI